MHPQDILNELRGYSCEGVHNFSLATLQSYFYLDQAVAKGTIERPAEGMIILPGPTGKTKTFVYGKHRIDASLLREARFRGPLYSIHEIPGEKNGSVFREIGYILPKVFDPASYPNAKKRHQRLKYPFTWMDDNVYLVEPAFPEDLPEITALHDKWVQHKLDDPNTFKMMFPVKRYLTCCQYALPRVERGFALSKRPAYAKYVPLIVRACDGRIVAVRVFGLQQGCIRSGTIPGIEEYVPEVYTAAMDLAFFGDTFSGKTPSQLMNYANVVMLKTLVREHNVAVVNCGASLNKHLKAFKAHFPHVEILSWAYPAMKRT